MFVTGSGASGPVSVSTQCVPTNPFLDILRENDSKFDLPLLGDWPLYKIFTKR